MPPAPAADATGLTIDIDYDDGPAVVTLAGEIDVYNATVLRTWLTGLTLAGHCRIVLDLSGMTYCDSSGLGVMVGAVKRTRAEDGGLTVFGAPEHFIKVLRITGLSKVLPAFADRAEALGWFAAP